MSSTSLADISGNIALTWLKALDPLVKVHYSWPIPLNTVYDEILYEYVRLTHAISLSGEWVTTEQIDRAVTVCKQVNTTNPNAPASIGINYSVWHQRFGEDLPPTNIGPTHDEELALLRTRLEFIRDAVAAANQTHNASVGVTVILFDSERFNTKTGDVEWNTAIKDKHNAAYDIAEEVFPGVRIEWYGRGAIFPSASPTGWSPSTVLSLEEKGNSFSCSLYRLPELGYTRETFRRTAQNAEDHGIDSITPWIALGAGYRRQADVFHKFEAEWNYDLIYSWQMGTEVNRPWFGAPSQADRYAPWNKASIVIFYPAPFSSNYWTQHFVAYARGASSVNLLPGD